MARWEKQQRKLWGLNAQGVKFLRILIALRVD
jgi:hypothetical protein